MLNVCENNYILNNNESHNFSTSSEAKQWGKQINEKITR